MLLEIQDIVSKIKLLSGGHLNKVLLKIKNKTEKSGYCEVYSGIKYKLFNMFIDPAIIIYLANKSIIEENNKVIRTCKTENCINIKHLGLEEFTEADIKEAEAKKKPVIDETHSKWFDLKHIFEDEKWSDVRGYKGFYKLSTIGRVHSIKSNKILKTKNGKITLSPNKRNKKDFLITDLITKHF